MARLSGELGDTVERVRSLSGGYALCEGARCLWHSGCCADLRDLAIWRSLLRDAPQEATWLAHAFFSTKRRPGSVDLFVQMEGSAEIDQFEISEGLIDAMLVNAHLEVLHFQARLDDALAGHVPDISRRQIAQRLTMTD
jgi:hypothetical protein